MTIRGFFKFDTDARKVIGKIDLGEDNRGGEIFFQEREGATEEDDGYLMTFVHNIQTDKSEFVMWDAKSMSETPVLRAQLDQRVPYGFHGLFIPESELE